MRTFSFEKLNVWQKSRQLSVAIYTLTKSFPDEERFGLISQMRRCAVSVSSNIAEGSGRHSSKDKARFTEISYSSLLELLNQLILSQDLELISEEHIDNHARIHFRNSSDVRRLI
ncbi:four helix bundle protein [uncultured Dokdonia sp.]|uniref:four helix bundle protein n=1 Tax=uncultured Dokdonia sp. TaxID=575653 RepID=UPI00262CC04E|nr:four helix bundle protein [uncultured Dokdonia sp.]